jgi:membrane-associated phospholipid phosphatase
MRVSRMFTMQSAAQIKAPGALSAFEILHVIGHARSPARLAAARSRRAWAGASAMTALACWWIVADHFALSRDVDTYVSATFNRLASQNAIINHAVLIASEATIITGALMIGLVWCCWFSRSAAAARERLLLGFGAVLITAILSRVLQVSLPLRLRPLHDAMSGFQPLPGIDTTLANHWGSFPSDHAALFFALVTVIWQRSRWLGLVALVSALYGTLPRIYLGLHYFSDVAAGALLGTGFVLMFEHYGPRVWAQRGIAWEQRVPGLFYGAAFLLSFEVATLFEDIRQVGRGIPSVMRQLGI